MITAKGIRSFYSQKLKSSIPYIPFFMTGFTAKIIKIMKAAMAAITAPPIRTIQFELCHKAKPSNKDYLQFIVIVWLYAKQMMIFVNILIGGLFKGCGCWRGLFTLIFLLFVSIYRRRSLHLPVQSRGGFLPRIWNDIHCFFRPLFYILCAASKAKSERTHSSASIVS